MRHIPGLYIFESEKGRGVYSAESISVEDTIEVCPIILIPETEKDIIHKTKLHDYYFIWPEGGICIALGYGSIYNHSFEPNAEIVFDLDNNEIIVECIKAIKPGEEILIDYSGGVSDHEFWFEVIK